MILFYLHIAYPFSSLLIIFIIYLFYMHVNGLREITLINDNLSYNMFFWSKLICYSLQFILLFVSMDVSRHIVLLDIFILAKSNMDLRE
jgi:hypothetical protein